MKTGLILFSALAILTALPAGAQCPTQNPARESQSTMDKVKEFLSEQWQDLTKDAEEKQKEAQSGNQDCSKAPKKTQSVKITAYEYLKKEVLAKTTDDADSFLPRTKDYGTARQQVKETFFVQPSEQLTERGKSVQNAIGFDATSLSGLTTTVEGMDILLKRDDYANAVAAKNLEISTTLREKVLADIASTKQAATDGCNQLQGMVLENRNLAALVAATASDIVIQILTMESLAARNLQKEGIALIPLPEKPTYDKKK